VWRGSGRSRRRPRRPGPIKNSCASAGDRSASSASIFGARRQQRGVVVRADEFGDLLDKRFCAAVARSPSATLAAVDDRFGGEQLGRGGAAEARRHAPAACWRFAGVSGEFRRSRSACSACVSLSPLFAFLWFLLDPLVHGIEVREHQLGRDDFDVADRIGAIGWGRRPLEACARTWTIASTSRMFARTDCRGLRPCSRP